MIVVQLVQLIDDIEIVELGGCHNRRHVGVAIKRAPIVIQVQTTLVIMHRS
jgi:hypothetical protein